MIVRFAANKHFLANDRRVISCRSTLTLFHFRRISAMTSLDLNKLKKRTVPEIERPKKKVDRFDGLSEEEVQRYTLDDYLETNLDIIFVGINPSLMAAHRGRYYAGPGNHFYKLLHESGLTPRFISFEEDYKLLRYGIGLTNIVTRATRSAADLTRTEIKEGAKIMEEKLKLYKPKIAVFNGKCIYDVFANITSRSEFHFGLQLERVGDTAIWVTPSSSARCANFPRMTDKLQFYTALRKYLRFLKGEITDVNAKEFWFEGKYKPLVSSTSKMWRRKNMSTFLQGGRVVNKNTLCQDTSEEDIAAVHTTEFIVHTHNSGNGNKDENTSFNRDMYTQENKTAAIDETAGKSENSERMERFVILDDVTVRTIVTEESKDKKSTETNRKDKNYDVAVNDILNQENDASCKNSKKHTYVKSKTLKDQNNSKSGNRDGSLDFMSVIKQRLSQKNNNSNVAPIIPIS